MSDQLNAEFLVQLHGVDLRYCHPRKRWLVWDGQRWQVDATAEVMRRAKATLHRLLGATEFVDDKQELSAWLRHLQGSFSTGRLKGMVGFFAQPPSCRARHEGGWAKNPFMKWAPLKLIMAFSPLSSA